MTSMDCGLQPADRIQPSRSVFDVGFMLDEWVTTHGKNDRLVCMSSCGHHAHEHYMCGFWVGVCEDEPEVRTGGIVCEVQAPSRRDEIHGSLARRSIAASASRAPRIASTSSRVRPSDSRMSRRLIGIDEPLGSRYSGNS